MNKCLMIIGMHRSGTSLTSSILQKAGLFIGEKLMGRGTANPKGHFENFDFLNFQMKALDFLSLDISGWSLQTIETLNTEFDKEAFEIVKINSREQWGWKDPRTTLFLSYWEKIIPGAKYLFVYRNPWDVADSLYRRTYDKHIIQDPFLAIRAWDFYNRVIIEMYKKHREDSILIHIDDILKDIPSFIQRINQELNFILNAENTAGIFDKSIFTFSDDNNLRNWQISLIPPNVIATLNELRTLTGKSKYETKNTVDALSMINEWFRFRSQQQRKIEYYQNKIELLNQENKDYQNKIELLNQEIMNYRKNKYS